MKTNKFQWHYLENQFENATSKSKKRMNILVMDHIAKLDAQKSDPDIDAIFTGFKPVQEAYSAKYVTWLKEKGVYKGATDTLERMFRELSSQKIGEWDNRIKVQVGEKTPEYTAIMPNGRGAFQKGNYDNRILEVKALAERLEGHTHLNDVKTDVETFAQVLENTRNRQQLHEELTDQASLELEQQRIITADEMYKNLGSLMMKFFNSTDNIALFFDLELIRQTGTDEDEPEPIVPDEEIIAITNQSALRQVVMIVTAPSGGMDIDWGDGNSETVTLDGSEQAIRHDYDGTGTYVISISGDLAGLTVFRMNQCSLTSLEVPATMTNLTNIEAGYNSLINAPRLSALNRLDYIHFGNNTLSEASVNEILVDADSFGTSNGHIFLHDGSNAAPSGDGLSAKTSLESRGWTVRTN